MANRVYKMVIGDSLPALDFLLQKPAGTALPNLATATGVLLKMRLKGTTEQINPDNEACSIIDATTGLVRWTPSETAIFTKPGIYEGEVEVTFADGKIQTNYVPFCIEVRGQIG